MPPPMQRVAMPRRASGRLTISWSSVTMIRAPEQPMGWPRAMEVRQGGADAGGGSAVPGPQKPGGEQHQGVPQVHVTAAGGGDADHHGGGAGEGGQNAGNGNDTGFSLHGNDLLSKQYFK